MSAAAEPDIAKIDDRMMYTTFFVATILGIKRKRIENCKK